MFSGAETTPSSSHRGAQIPSVGSIKGIFGSVFSFFFVGSGAMSFRYYCPEPRTPERPSEPPELELELELIQIQMAQKPMLRAEVYAHAMRASQHRKKEVRRESPLAF